MVVVPGLGVVQDTGGVIGDGKGLQWSKRGLGVELDLASEDILASKLPVLVANHVAKLVVAVVGADDGFFKLLLVPLARDQDNSEDGVALVHLGLLAMCKEVVYQLAVASDVRIFVE